MIRRPANGRLTSGQDDDAEADDPRAVGKFDIEIDTLARVLRQKARQQDPRRHRRPSPSTQAAHTHGSDVRVRRTMKKPPCVRTATKYATLG